MHKALCVCYLNAGDLGWSSSEKSITEPKGLTHDLKNLIVWVGTNYCENQRVQAKWCSSMEKQQRSRNEKDHRAARMRKLYAGDWS